LKHRQTELIEEICAYRVAVRDRNAVASLVGELISEQGKTRWKDRTANLQRALMRGREEASHERRQLRTISKGWTPLAFVSAMRPRVTYKLPVRKELCDEPAFLQFF
jgi:hypothetical protein